MRDALMRLLEPPIEALGLNWSISSLRGRDAAACCGYSSIGAAAMPRPASRWMIAHA